MKGDNMTKKIAAIIIAMMLLFCSCGSADVTQEETEHTTEKTQPMTDGGKLLFRGVWLSYIEISENSPDRQGFEDFLDKRFTDFSALGITDVFFHLRPFGDALYESELFPSSDTVCKNQGDELPFDYVEAALKKAKEYGLKLHGWINPYRISHGSDITALSEENQGRIWYEKGTGEVLLSGDRFYFNPARENVRRLIIDGVRELMEKYPELAGIHTDDYFYPEGMASQDSADYEAYVKNGGEMSLGDWRRENVSILMREIYSAVKEYGSDRVFSVSPDGKPEYSRDSLFADVEKWCSEEGYCDIILPQIYFGFNNQKHPFDQSLEEWTELCKGSEVRLVPGLALYKCGNEDKYAGEGINEWQENSDIIKRQVMLIKDNDLHGFALYSGSYVNFSESFCKKELDNLISVL